MSLDQQGPLHLSSPEAIRQDESLVSSAQNFLIGLGLVAHRAKEQNLAYSSPYANGGKIVYAATPAGNIGIIKIMSGNDGAERYILQPIVPGGIYGRNPEIQYETIESTEGATVLSVKMHGYPRIRSDLRQLSMMGRTEQVVDPAKARVLEEFVSELTPLSNEEYVAMCREQSNHKNSNVSFAKKIGRLLSRKSSH